MKFHKERSEHVGDGQRRNAKVRGGRRKELKAIGLVEALHFTTSQTAVIGVKCCPANQHLYPCDNNWGARGNWPADRVAKPLSS
jgi:hypothetical protein